MKKSHVLNCLSSSTDAPFLEKGTQAHDATMRCGAQSVFIRPLSSLCASRLFWLMFMARGLQSGENVSLCFDRFRIECHQVCGVCAYVMLSLGVRKERKGAKKRFLPDGRNFPIRRPTKFFLGRHDQEEQQRKNMRPSVCMQSNAAT